MTSRTVPRLPWVGMTPPSLPAQAGRARVHPLGAGWGQSIPLPAGQGRGPQASSGEPFCSQAVGPARHPTPLCHSHPSWGILDFLLASDAPLMLAPLGWWQRAVPKPSGLACGWEEPCRVAGLLLTQIYSPWRGWLGPGAEACPWLQEMGKPCLAQGWPGSIWHRASLTARCPEPGCGSSHRMPQGRTAPAGLPEATLPGAEAGAQ